MSNKKTNDQKQQVVKLENLSQAKDILKKLEETRVQNLNHLTDEDAKQFTAFVASISNYVNAQAKTHVQDERMDWNEFLDQLANEAYQNKDIGAVLTYSQNMLFIYESLLDEGNFDVLTSYCRRILSLSILHERLNITKSNGPLAVRACKYMNQVKTLEELECLVALVEKDAMYQFTQKNFDVSVNNHKKIYEARLCALNSKEFLESGENIESKLKFSQIKTGGNLVAALAEQRQVEEALSYFEKSKALENDPATALFLKTTDGNRALAGLYMNASACYNQKKDRAAEKDLLTKALQFITENEERDEDETNMQNALLRRRITSLLELNKENIWYSSSKEYQESVHKAIQLADSTLRECMNGNETPDHAQRLEDAINELEKLHAVDLIISSIRFSKFCQICGDLHRRASDAASINRYWYKKTVGILRELQRDDISFDLNDLALSLFYLAIYERESEIEESIEHQKQSIFIFEQLNEKGKIRDKNHLAMGYHNLAVSYAKQNDKDGANEYGLLALNLWKELITKEGRTELEGFLEPCRSIIEWSNN
ncbi:hypothetical protein P261_02811 [Lachnospiraceae bacterium TWA4]|nr:hypothetical protein P261_02811 [Lachnospiraceae bacterium TWA4]